jgi:hypothetical protein
LILSFSSADAGHVWLSTSENRTSVVRSLTQEKYFYSPYSTQPVYGFLMHQDSIKMRFPIYHLTRCEPLYKTTSVAFFIEVASKIWQGLSFPKNSMIYDKKLFSIANILYFSPNIILKQSKQSSLPDISFTTTRLLKGFLWIRSSKETEAGWSDSFLTNYHLFFSVLSHKIYDTASPSALCTLKLTGSLNG